MTIYNNHSSFNQVRFVETATSNHLTENNEIHKSLIIPTSNDVLNGRGKSIYAWQGNVFYRDLIKYYKLEYIVASPDEQKLIAQTIISTIRGLTPPGRFLEMDKSSHTWCEIGDDKAMFKVRQALREGAPELRQQLTPSQYDSSSDEKMSDGECKELLEMVS